jgi:hypothetical protein
MGSIGFGDLWTVDDICIGVCTDGGENPWIWMDYREGERTTSRVYDMAGNVYDTRRPLEITNASQARELAATLIKAAEELEKLR